MSDCKGLRIGTLLALACCASVLSTGAALAAEISVTTDGRYQLINKVNGAERWMLARELASGRIVANVFNPNDPLDLTFFDCVQTGADAVDYFFFCNISAGGSAWSGAGLENIPVARSFFGESAPPPPPPPASCVVYTDACGAPPRAARASGGSFFLRDNGGPWEEFLSGSVLYDLSVSYDLDERFGPARIIALSTTTGFVIGFQEGEVGLSGDGRIVMNSAGEPSGGVTFCGGQRVIRTRTARVELCTVCGIDGPVTGTAHAETTISDGSACSIDIEFRAFRTE